MKNSTGGKKVVPIRPDFVMILAVNQDKETGAVTPDPVDKTIGCHVWFSGAFDITKESELRTTINQVKSEILSQHVEEFNKNVPANMRYREGRHPSFVHTQGSLRGQIVHVCEIELSYDEETMKEIELTNQTTKTDGDEKPGHFKKFRIHDPFLLKAHVVGVRISKPLMCMAKVQRENWKYDNTKPVSPKNPQFYFTGTPYSEWKPCEYGSKQEYFEARRANSMQRRNLRNPIKGIDELTSAAEG